MNSSVDKRSEDTDRRREKVAVLWEKGMHLRDILAEFDRVGIKGSASTVHADIEHLIREGIIRPVTSLPPERAREIEDEFEKDSYRSLLDHLIEKTRGRVTDLWVGHSGSTERAKDCYRNWLAQFGRNGCSFFEDQIRRSACIGTFGGSTTAALVDALPPEVAGSKPSSVEVVPLAGDPPKLSKHPATSVARRLSAKLTGSDATVPSLEGVTHAPKERANLVS
jgi:DNA-binding transcriptional regulator LsrR (DeoR family)